MTKIGRSEFSLEPSGRGQKARRFTKRDISNAEHLLLLPVDRGGARDAMDAADLFTQVFLKVLYP